MTAGRKMGAFATFDLSASLWFHAVGVLAFSVEGDNALYSCCCNVLQWRIENRVYPKDAFKWLVTQHGQQCPSLDHLWVAPILVVHRFFSSIS